MIVVSDSTPLMHFGKIDRLDLLQLGYDEIVITQAVYRETVTEVLNIGEKDAILIEKAVGKRLKKLYLFSCSF